MALRCPLPVACLLTTAFCVWAALELFAAAPKSVLILSEGPVLPYGATLRENIIAALRRDSAEPLNIYEELIDRIRFDSDEYDRQLVALYKSKYLAAPPALIITVTEPALDFALRHRDELFSHSALLFGAVDERVTRDRMLGPNTTGVFSHYDARATIEAALTLHPGTRRIVVVGGTSRLDRGYTNVAREDLAGLKSPVTITYLDDKPLRDVLGTVAALRNDALVLFLSMQADGEGVARTGPEVLAALRREANIPIYGMSGNFLGRGIVGGMLFDVESHGLDLAQRARQILSGAQAADLVPIRSPNTLSFDWRELERFGIDEARLPPGATVVNREISLWDAYKQTVLIAGAVLVGQSVLIGSLLLQRQRRRRAELAIRDLSGRLLTAQEEERRRIARELHDNVSQQISLLGIQIDLLAKNQTGPPAAMAQSMRELHEQVREISSDVHSLSHQLHSSKLEALGLVEALRAHCQELLVRGLRTSFYDEQVPESLPHDVELCLFRIVQEALNNVVKHSGAREAHVTLCATGDMLVLSVSDSGEGFDLSRASVHGGLGLASMRERLRLVNGELKIRSQQGQGTTVVARVPILIARSKAASDSPRVA